MVDYEIDCIIDVRVFVYPCREHECTTGEGGFEFEGCVYPDFVRGNTETD